LSEMLTFGALFHLGWF